MSGSVTGLLGPLQIKQPDPNQPDEGSALAGLYGQVSDYLAQQQQKSTDMGLWTGGGLLGGGHPTAKGAADAAKQYAGGLLFGTTAPEGSGITAYHGSPADFSSFDASKIHPDEAGHYFALDERLAQDYAGRSARDPTAGHMYQVNINADPAQFLDYGSLSPADQAALNDPGAVQKLRDAGVPGIKFPDRTMTVFDDNTINIIRKYGIAGLGIGLGGAAAGRRNGGQ